MKIIHRDFKHGRVKVSISNLDDLWALYNVIQKNDIVRARTTREVKMDFTARPSSRRVPVTLGVRVQKTYFDREINRLRVHGIVSEAPEDLDVTGSHHTLNLAVDETLEIVKDRWLRHQVERLEKAVAEEPPVAIVAIDSEEACVAVLHTYGLDVKAEILSRLAGKAEPEKREEAFKEYFSRVSKALQIPQKGTRIVVVGPGFTKDNFVKYLKAKSPEQATDIVAVKSVSVGGVGGVHEATRSGIINKILRDARALSEMGFVEEVLRRLGASRGDISYGTERVEQDAMAGAVELLLVCDETLREISGEDRSRVESIMRVVEKKGGRVTLISSEHEGGRKLLSLGGLAALLRYARHC